MSKNYSTMLGITEVELRENFKEYILDFSNEFKITEAELLEKIRHWYNGYCFAGEGETVYNPERQLYTLDFPNFEVKSAFLQYFIRSYTDKIFHESKLGEWIWEKL